MLGKISYIALMVLSVSIASVTAGDDSSFKPFNRKPTISLDIELPLDIDLGYG